MAGALSMILGYKHALSMILGYKHATKTKKELDCKRRIQKLTIDGQEFPGGERKRCMSNSTSRRERGTGNKWKERSR
jgi:hypothetical protein